MTPHRWVMKAVGEPMIREPLELQAPAPGEVLVEVAGCGVCHTDSGFLYDGVRTNQPLPLALGHEISGRVVRAGAGAEAWVGKAVVVPAVIPCGECDACRRGKGTICPTQKMPGNDIHGGFATHVQVPARGLCAVDEARLAKAGLALADVSVVADAVTTPYQAVTQAGVLPGQLVVVNGVGGVGSYCVQIAAALGATVVALDVDPKKLEMVAEQGASKTINVREIDPKNLKKEIGAFAKAKGLPSREWTISSAPGPPRVRPPPSGSSSTAPPSRWWATPWTRSRSGSRTSWPSTRAPSGTGAARPSSTPPPSTSCSTAG